MRNLCARPDAQAGSGQEAYERGVIGEETLTLDSGEQKGGAKLSGVSQHLERIGRIPTRVRNDVRLFRMLKNWREAVTAEITGATLSRLEMRNGVVINAPETLNLAFLFHEIWVQRTYTPPGYEIRDGDVVIDIGANIGVFATYAATVAPNVKVYSYEPFPGNVAWLRRNVEESGLKNVRICEQAVGAPGQRKLHVSRSSWIFHSLVREEGNGEQDITVECVNLDQVLNTDEVQRCDLLKLDCEGSEYEILMDCRTATLKRIRRIVGEYHEGPQIEKTGQDLCHYLESNSFRIDYFGPLEVDSGIFHATNIAD